MTSCLKSPFYLAGMIMWMIQTLMILFPPLIDRGRQAAREAILSGWEFLQIWPSRLWLPFPPAAAIYFVPGITSLQDGDKCNAKDMKRSGSELATAVHRSAVRD